MKRSDCVIATWCSVIKHKQENSQPDPKLKEPAKTSSLFRIIAVLLNGYSLASAQTPAYVNFIRQVQFPSGVQWDATVASSGEQLSALTIDPGGARFELWTVKASPLTSYLLDSCYVGTFVPLAGVVIRSEDPYPLNLRTRADRPFAVDVSVTGLLAGATDPAASKAVSLLRHVQSYGAGGTGYNLDRHLATLHSTALVTSNGTQTFTFPLTSIPGSDLAKVGGEERFSVYSMEDYQAPASQLVSKSIQIWPVADGTISGITQGQMIRFSVPQVTITLNDLYPSSTTYVQVYKGDPQLGVDGTKVPGSSLIINDCVPQSRVLTLKGYEAVFDADGRWTMELLTATAFGIDRLATVGFNVNRVLEVNGMFTDIE